MSSFSPISSIVSPTLATPKQLAAMEEGNPTFCESMFIPDSPTNLHKIIAELVGTYILVFVGCASIISDGIHKNLSMPGIALAWGFVVMAVIFCLGHVSGAHINPAVTIGLAVSKNCPWKQVPTYILSQLLGSILASLTLYVLFRNKPVSIDSAVSGYTVSSISGYSVSSIEALVWEFIVSFILMFVILGVATDHRAPSQLLGIAVGGTIIFNALIAGPVTGCSMNPARSIGPAIVSGKFDHLWVYIFAPVLGMVAAALLYGFLRVPAPEPDTTKNT